MAEMDNLLAAIMQAVYGEEVRGSIHDAVRMCYEEMTAGKAEVEAARVEIEAARKAIADATAGGGEVDADVAKLYPIGSIYMNVNLVSPNTLFGGTWERIQDRFLLASGTTYNAATQRTGGSADAVVVQHTHDGSSSSSGNHGHIPNPNAIHTIPKASSSKGITSSYNYEHNHYASDGGYAYLTTDNTTGIVSRQVKIDTSSGIYAPTFKEDSNFVRRTATDTDWDTHYHDLPEHTHDITIPYDGTHSHTMSLNQTGVSGTGKNMPPYQVVYVWQRTA